MKLSLTPEAASKLARYLMTPLQLSCLIMVTETAF